MLTDNQVKDALLQFFKAWLEWAEAGGSEDHLVFSGSNGLCTNLRWYLAALPEGEYTHWEENSIKEELYHLLFAEFGENDAPFNTSLAEYFTSWDHHKNPKRLTWVRTKIKQFQGELHVTQ